MKESDWEIFKQIKDKAVNEFCKQALQQHSEIIGKPDASAHQRYGELYENVRTLDKEMARIFDYHNHSRSNAGIILMTLRANNLADSELIAKLSPEFEQQTRAYRDTSL